MYGCVGKLDLGLMRPFSFRVVAVGHRTWSSPNAYSSLKTTLAVGVKIVDLVEVALWNNMVTGVSGRTYY